MGNLGVRIDLQGFQILADRAIHVSFLREGGAEADVRVPVVRFDLESFPVMTDGVVHALPVCARWLPRLTWAIQEPGFRAKVVCQSVWSIVEHCALFPRERAQHDQQSCAEYRSEKKMRAESRANPTVIPATAKATGPMQARY